MSEESSGEASGRFSALQRLCLVIAAIVSTSGAGLWGVGAMTGEPEPAPAAQAQGGSDGPEGFQPQGFVESNSGDSGTEGASEDGGESSATGWEAYAPTVFRLGFGFFVGFAIAQAIRAALKVVVIVSGAVLLLLIGLQMAGFITVNWEALEGTYDGIVAWMGTQTESLTAFLQGYIPSGGSAIAGFGIGMLKRKD